MTIEPTYEHCRNCGTPTISSTGYCRDCNPQEARLVLSFGKNRRTLQDLRFMAQWKKTSPSRYVMDLIQRDIDAKIAEINKDMKLRKNTMG
jgi:hypothetical protein